MPALPLFRRGLLAALLLGSAAQAAPIPVSATNTILADLVRQVGGGRVQVTALVPAGADPHAFQPGTGVIRSLSLSRALFANGAGLEPWLPRLRAAAPGVPVHTMLPSPHITIQQLGAAPDPHAWWNLRNAADYARQISAALSALDPAGKPTYEKNRGALVTRITALESYARTQVSRLPASRRLLITNHDSLNYFAQAYGLKVVGVIFPGLGTEREPSARELASLIGAVKQSGARVIFTENTVNARLAQTLASETGARIAPPLYTDALGPQGSPGSTLLGAFRYNVDTIVQALK